MCARRGSLEDGAGTLVYPAAMRRLRAWFTRINAFRIGLFTGLAFAALHVLQLAGRTDVPVLTRMEGALADLRFLQRVKLLGSEHSGQVVLAAVDEAAIAKFGRFPWDRRVIAALIDKLDAAGAKAIGFDMSFSDEDLGGQFAGAKRYRKRFEDISLAAPRNRAAIEGFDEAESQIAGAPFPCSTINTWHTIGPTHAPCTTASVPCVSLFFARAGKAVTDFCLSGCQITHQPQSADAPSGVATKVHDQASRIFEMSDGSVEHMG